jgi:hypothetical protein
LARKANSDEIGSATKNYTNWLAYNHRSAIAHSCGLYIHRLHGFLYAHAFECKSFHLARMLDSLFWLSTGTDARCTLWPNHALLRTCGSLCAWASGLTWLFSLRSFLVSAQAAELGVMAKTVVAAVCPRWPDVRPCWDGCRGR